MASPREAREADWVLWAQELSSLEENGKFRNPLSTHQQWHCFTDRTTLHCNKILPIQYTPRYCTRSVTAVNFDTSSPGTAVNVLPPDAVPATLQPVGLNPSCTVFKLNSSSSPIPHSPTHLPMTVSSSPLASIISEVPPQMPEILASAEQKNLSISCDGS
jgi:hypothetical protein